MPTTSIPKPSRTAIDRRANGRGWSAWVFVGLLFAVTSSCQRPDGPPATSTTEVAVTADDTATPSPREIPPPSTPLPEHPDRWLVVEKALDDQAGAWAKGGFNPDRNKISVVTQGVAEFSIDIDKIAVDWDRLVILGINGMNTELRRRDYSPLLFRRDPYGRWSVVEPK